MKELFCKPPTVKKEDELGFGSESAEQLIESFCEELVPATAENLVLVPAQESDQRTAVEDENRSRVRSKLIGI